MSSKPVRFLGPQHNLALTKMPVKISCSNFKDQPKRKYENNRCIAWKRKLGTKALSIKAKAKY